MSPPDWAKTTQCRQAVRDWPRHICIKWPEENPSFHGNFVSSDKRSSWSDRTLNQQDWRNWRAQCSDSIYEFTQNIKLFMIWYATYERHVIGPYFSHDALLLETRGKRRNGIIFLMSWKTTTLTRFCSAMSLRHTIPLLVHKIYTAKFVADETEKANRLRGRHGLKI